MNASTLWWITLCPVHMSLASWIKPLDSGVTQTLSELTTGRNSHVELLWHGCRHEELSTSSFNLASQRRTPTLRASMASSGTNASTRTGLNPCPRQEKLLPVGGRTTTRCGHTDLLDGYLRLHSQPSIAAMFHHLPKQDRLTCKPLDLSPIEWYGQRGQVNALISTFALSILIALNGDAAKLLLSWCFAGLFFQLL